MMTVKTFELFISYSHKDASFLNNLTTHLEPLRKNGVISDWCDRELVAGDKLDKEIETALARADIFVFLVSSDFLASWYCFDMELKAALDRLEDSEIRVVPVIVRPCLWRKTVLGDFLAAPEEGEPIAKWGDIDEAFVDVVTKIEKNAERLVEMGKEKEKEAALKTEVVKADSWREIALAEEFASYLQGTEITFSNRGKDNVSLSDIFVYPDLVNEKKEYEEFESYLSSAEIAVQRQDRFEVLIHGAEQAGKTSLAKIFFSDSLSLGGLPIFAKGQEIGSSDAKELIKRGVRGQYKGISSADYKQLTQYKTLIVDDFHLLKLNGKYLPKLLDSIRSCFDCVIFIADSSIKYDEARFSQLYDFWQYKILPFGAVKRGELVEKWNCLGRAETIPLEELYAANDTANRYVNSLIRKNVLPSKPVYVLTTLHLLDAGTPSDLSISSYGHCYQMFIQQAFQRAGIQIKEIDGYVNYLSELAFYIYNYELDVVSEKHLAEFEGHYSERYVVNPDASMSDTLLKSGVLRSHPGGMTFGYKYIYYFYVAKYFTDHLDRKDCSTAIEKLCWDIHSERNANILVFVVHHSKDPVIIKEVLDRSSLIFDGVEEASLLPSELKSIEALISNIPSLVLESREVEQERGKQLQAQDRANGIEDCDETPHGEEDLVHSQDETFADITRSARMVEVIGQILRNRHASLPKDQLIDMAEAAYTSGLRFLGFYLEFMTSRENEMLSMIEHFISQDTSLSDEQVTKRARSLFLAMVYTTSYGVISKIAHSVGTESLMPIFKKVAERHGDSPAVRLIDVGIRLEFTKSIPRKEIEDLYLSLESNKLVQRLLQEIVVRHLYLNPISYQDRGWIASTLKLEMKDQRVIQSKKEEKA